MFEVLAANGTVRIRLSSERALVTQAVEVCTRHLKKQGVSCMPSLGLVARELILNAIDHGNQNDPAREVVCQCERQGEVVRVTVEDQGEGFDPSVLDMRIPEDPVRRTRRGYVLVNALSKTLEFNEKGNRVTAYVTVDGSKLPASNATTPNANA